MVSPHPSPTNVLHPHPLTDQHAPKPTRSRWTSTKAGFTLILLLLGVAPLQAQQQQPTVTTLEVGNQSSCVLFDDNTLKCWGDATNGGLGNGSTTLHHGGKDRMGANLPAVDLGTGRTVQQLAMGGTHHCAILDDNSLKCWGDNRFNWARAPRRS